MPLGDRLRTARGGVSQRLIAEDLGVAREAISMWETGARAPSDEVLRRIAKLYGVSYGWLVGAEAGEAWSPEALMLRRAGTALTSAERSVLLDWLTFLDRWAERLLDLGAGSTRGPRRPPKPLDGLGPVYDTRRAPTLAARVRDHLGVGDGPLPDLYALLDAFGVLVYRSDGLPHVGGAGVVSGAFVNHDALGYCVFVNVRCSAGRQAFTLAHELAHALFHYPERATVSLGGDRAQEERFANAFASHFLVPGKELRGLAKRWIGGALDEYGAVQLAAHFRVSYAMMLYRLLDEGLAERADVDVWKTYSPVALADRLGIPADPFCHAPEGADGGLDRFPMSVRNAVHLALRAGRVHVSQAADILGVEAWVLEAELAPPSQTDERAALELEEYPEF